MSYYEETKTVLKAFLDQYKDNFDEDTLLVVGCSSSEVMGGTIGKNSNVETGAEIAKAVMDTAKQYGIQIAAQCCEHLNRALVVEKTTAKAKGYEQVTVVPQPKAGGSFATAVYKNMKNPVMVEEVKADYGIDIGLTMIGMHMKRVAVPVRLNPNRIGEALVCGAKSRPKLIGGERAHYKA
jgi:uncharacterized protein (TIGR01440 family)